MVRIHFELALKMSGEKYSPSLRSLSTCWRMRDVDSTACYNFLQKCYYPHDSVLIYLLLWKDQKIQRMRNFSVLSLVAKIWDICECKRMGYYLHARLTTRVVCML